MTNSTTQTTSTSLTKEDILVITNRIKYQIELQLTALIKSRLDAYLTQSMVREQLQLRFDEDLNIFMNDIITDIYDRFNID